MRSSLRPLTIGLVFTTAIVGALAEDLPDWLSDRAVVAVEQGNLRRADREAAVALWLGARRTDAWWHSDVIHHANLVRGLVALHAGDRASAKQRLLAVARTSGSPVLVSFGPNMRLAQELLAAGEKGAGGAIPRVRGEPRLLSAGGYLSER
jgi:hypothetical protein